MNSELIYQKLLEKVDRNLSDTGIALDKARSVSLFNEEMHKFIEYTSQKRNTFDILDIQVLLTTKSLEEYKSSQKFTQFKLPKEFFSFVNVDVTATNGKCSVGMLTTEIKPENESIWLNDINLKPSFKAREVLYSFESDTIKIFKDTDFEIGNVSLKYYRYPKPYNISGIIDEEGNMSKDSVPEFDDKVIDRIISMCATSFDINHDYLERVQTDINRVISKI